MQQLINYGIMSFQTSKRLALVFGNAKYPDSPLRNTRKDAEDVGLKLESLGFVVGNVLLDRELSAMLDDIEKFTAGIDDDVSDIVLYYAGHGCRISESLNPRLSV